MEKGKELIHELMFNTHQFNKLGKSYDLLREYFNGLPLKTLKPLINSDDEGIQDAAFWILSELGIKGIELMPDVINILRNKSSFCVEYYSIEFIFICSQKTNLKDFVFVINGMYSDHQPVRINSMYLVSNALNSQIETVLEDLGDSHKKGLNALLKYEKLDKDQIVEMLKSEDETIRKYGIIIAKKCLSKYSIIISEASKHIDIDVRQFAQRIIETEIK